MGLSEGSGGSDWRDGPLSERLTVVVATELHGRNTSSRVKKKEAVFRGNDLS
jgi:hypothetical protein